MERSRQSQRQPEQNQPIPEEGQHIPGLSEPQAEIQSRLSIWELLERDVNLEALNASQRADVVSRYSSNSQELRTAMDRIDEEYWSERKVLVGLENEIDETGTEHDKLILELYHTVRFESPIIRLPIIYPRSFSTEELAQFRAQFEALPKEELAVEIQKSKERAEQNKKNHEQIMRQWPRGAAMS